MDYLITMEDGSSVCLSHHGVKGMKWGVWNEETRARHEGGSSKQKIDQREEAARRAIDQAKKYKEDNAAVYKRNSGTYGVTTWKSGASKGVSGIEVHGFDDSKYTKRSKRLATEVAKAKADSKFELGGASHTDALAENYINYLVKHGRKRSAREAKAGAVNKAMKFTTEADKAAKYAHLQDITRHQMDIGRMALHESMRMSQQAAQISAQEAARAGSLSLTGGANPFMFG